MISIEKFFSFHENDKIVVGCSTGPDSMALVDMLLKIRDKYHLSIIICHVNHNVRKESYQEAEFIKNYCNLHHLFFETMTIEEYGDDNFHNEARNIRYQFFDNTVKKYNANYLMTAHHGDDLMETILMRMVRGSNLSGYSGFKKIVEKEGYQIVRPLISLTKQELIEYDYQNKVPFFLDKSNEKDKYTRNRYRKYILPFLKEEDSNVHLKFLKFSKALNDSSVFIDKITKDAMKRCVRDNTILVDCFLKEDEFIQKEILYSFLKDYYQDDLILINDKHIELLLQLFRNKKANSFVNLPNDVLAKKTYNNFTFVKDVDAITSYEIEFDRYALLPNKHSIELVDSVDNNSNNVCRLNSKEIMLPLIIRTRRMGDRIYIKGLNGSKKVKDIFIDKKISADERDLWPIVLDSQGHVVWVPGIKKSKFDKKSTEEYDIILRYN
ncbi:MAG: tRNA lysidine(34) synthetase TilS [Bacilli bacterium]|nr:tRNA lysidine(34) synthetase TilS [Bacilli bacterium]